MNTQCQKRPVGFSTGCLFEIYEPTDPEAITAIMATGADAVELTTHDIEDLADLKDSDIFWPLLSEFKHVSVHVHKNAFRDAHEASECIKLLEWLQEEYGTVAAIIHPDELTHPSLLKNVGFPVMLENMDARKKSFTTVEELQAIMDILPDARLCLDLNHCFTHDPTMKLAERFLSAFSGRIGEIHLSGFEKFHEPLSHTKQSLIIGMVPNDNTPIIIESGCITTKILGDEFSYVVNALSAHRHA